MIKKNVLKRAGMASAILCLGLVATSTRASENFSFDDIHYWIGEGTNQAGIVVDWNNGRPGSSLAWGVRWNGASTNLTGVLQNLDHQDRRLHVGLDYGGGWGTALRGFAYDVNNNGGFFDLRVPGAATDADDFVAMDNFSGSHYWTVIGTNAATVSHETEWKDADFGVDGVYPQDGDWWAFKRISSAWPPVESSFPAVPVAAETPFAFEVIAYHVDPYENFINPEAVLGPPSRMTGADDENPETWGPVTPALAAMNEHQLLALSMTEDDYGDEPGFVTIAFDHRVLDDPMNPYGLDFIVFGNVLQGSRGQQYLNGQEDPASVEMTLNTNEEPGTVEVSQDGVTWYTYDEGPFADTFAPTLGYLYETNAPDASLFEGNLWWGRPADPTLPVDPALTAADFVGRTLAEYATLYNGSAGGTGFDIGIFDLPADEATGYKWIQYVRVTGGSNTEDANWTDIDAFADVSPALPYDNWVREHYEWTDLPNQAVSGKQALAANGKPNFYNAAFGLAPNEPALEDFTISSFSVENGQAIFRLPFAGAYDAFRVGKASVVDGKYRDRLPTFEGTVETPSGVESVFSISLDDRDEKAFYKIGISAK